jgi:hypothetical protein
MVQTTKNVENKLSSQEIEDLLAESDKFQKLSSFEYLGKEWDTQSFWAFIIGIGTWIVFWKLFNLGYIFKSWNAEWIGHLTFILYIIISFMNFFNSATNVSDVESERVNIAAQQSFIQGGIAVFILPFVFSVLFELSHTESMSAKPFIFWTFWFFNRNGYEIKSK